MSIIASLEADLHAVWAKLEAEGHHVADEVKAILDRLRADAPKVVGEAEADAADVVHTAATEGVVPAEREAVADGETLLADAGHDIAAAVEGSGKSGDSTDTPSA